MNTKIKTTTADGEKTCRKTCRRPSEFFMNKIQNVQIVSLCKKTAKQTLYRYHVETKTSNSIPINKTH